MIMSDVGLFLIFSFGDSVPGPGQVLDFGRCILLGQVRVFSGYLGFVYSEFTARPELMTSCRLCANFPDIGLMMIVCRCR
jgi:hypothetical protein